MDVNKEFHMKGGHGETSYTNNSSIQKSVAEKVVDITLEAIEEMYVALRPRSLGIADLGCSTGLNSLLYIKRIVHTLEKSAQTIQQSAPELQVCLNDLPSNDFNIIFRALPGLYKDLKIGRDSGAPSVFVAAYPGNFYGRLFPENSLHFAYSISCLHWLSKVPPGIYDEKGMSINKKGIYISRNSSPQVCKAYAKQFEDDFSQFLNCRSQELVTGGRMVLVFTIRKGPDFYSKDNTFMWELLYQSLHNLVSKGEVEEDKLDNYDVHFYRPSKEEIEDAVRKQGSFKLDRLEIFGNETQLTKSSVGLAKAVRAVQEPMLSQHFGGEILDNLFDEYGRLLNQEKDDEDLITFYDVVLILTKSFV